MSTKRERPTMIAVGHIEVASDSEEGAWQFLTGALGIDRSRVTRLEEHIGRHEGVLVYRFYIRDLRRIK